MIFYANHDRTQINIQDAPTAVKKVIERAQQLLENDESFIFNS